jgi:hypothetical protein
MAAQRTTIFLLERDVRLIRTLQGRYGLTTQSDVIRFALRTLGAARAAEAEPGQRHPAKRAQREQLFSRRQELLAKAQAVSAQAKKLQRRVAAYLKEHKG